MFYPAEGLRALVERVLRRLYREWSSLPTDDQDRIDQMRHALADRLAEQSTSGAGRSEAMGGFLDGLLDFPSLPSEVESIIREGRGAEDSPATTGPSYFGVINLNRLLRDDPAKYTVRGIGDALPRPPAMVRPPAEAITQPEALPDLDVSFFTYVDFPQKIGPDTKRSYPLIIQLVRNQPEESRVDEKVDISFENPNVPELLEVRVMAPGFDETSVHDPTRTTAAWSRSMTVYSYQDSQPVVFLLRLSDSRPGSRWIMLDFYHRGRNVGSFRLECSVSAFQPGPSNRTQNDGPHMGGASIIEGPEGVDLPRGTPPPAADVEIRIIKAVDDNTLHFELNSARLGYQQRRMGSVTIAGMQNPQELLQTYFDRLSQMAAEADGALDQIDAADFESEISNMGVKLYEDIFPEELKAEYWKLKALREQGAIETLLITSDEPWIPWELVKPYYGPDDPDEEDVEDDHLAGAWQMSRWLAGRGAGSELQISVAQLVAPELDLPFVQEEEAYFDSLKERAIKIAKPIRTRRDFMKLVESEKVQLLHFATHGDFRPADADRSPIILEDGSIYPAELTKRQVRGIRRERPFFFLNTCHGGQIGFNLTGLGGWAEQLLRQVGATAFIGALWEVNDELASTFAHTFYEALWQGKTLGAAFAHARSTIRKEQPANPTWLAYTLYGDPNSRIHWGPDR